MGQRRTGNSELIVFKQQTGLNGMHFDGIGKMSLGIATRRSEKFIQLGRPIDVNPTGIARQSATCQQPHQPVGVIAVHVGDEDARNLAAPHIASQKLVLRAFATVEQPNLRSLWQAEGNAGDIARSGGHT